MNLSDEMRLMTEDAKRNLEGVRYANTLRTYTEIQIAISNAARAGKSHFTLECPSVKYFPLEDAINGVGADALEIKRNLIEEGFIISHENKHYPDEGYTISW